jgi:hypothetical protein
MKHNHFVRSSARSRTNWRQRAHIMLRAGSLRPALTFPRLLRRYFLNRPRRQRDDPLAAFLLRLLQVVTHRIDIEIEFGGVFLSRPADFINNRVT